MTGTEPHAPRGAAGRGTQPGPLAVTGHARAARRCTKRHRRLWAQPGRLAVTGRGSYASTHAHLSTAGSETLWGSRAASGPEELRDSEWSHGCRRDAVTVCFQYLVSQVTVSDDSAIFLNWLGSIQNWTLRFRSCRLNWEPQVLRQTAGNPDQSSYNRDPNRV